MLAYLSRYTHRVAISNSRLIRLDDKGVTFRWKDYRARGKAPGRSWIKPMTLPADEFIRRFLMHVLPDGFHRIRHYGLFASPRRAANILRLRDLIAAGEQAAKPVTKADLSQLYSLQRHGVFSFSISSRCPSGIGNGRLVCRST